MKKFVFVLLFALTYFLSAMYRSIALLTLCGIEIITAMTSLIIPRILRGRLSLRFPVKTLSGHPHEKIADVILVRSAGKLPVSRFSLRIRTRSFRQSKADIDWISSGSLPGDNQVQFSLTLPYCGLFDIQADCLRVYDYLGLFSTRKKLSLQQKAAVFPPDITLRIKQVPTGAYTSFPPEEAAALTRFSQGGDEIRQIRDYQSGDALRHIHWPLSAKLDRLQVREYLPNTGETINLLLDLDGLDIAEPKYTDAFYRIFSALVLGLFQHQIAVCVFWQTDGKLTYAEISSPETCRETLLRLYQLENTENIALQQLPVFSAKRREFRINLHLECFYQGQIVYRFSPNLDELNAQIQKNIFTL